MRKFRREISDPTNAVAIFEERVNENKIGLFLFDDFVRLTKRIRGAANTIPGVASDNCGHSLFANDRVADHYDLARFFARASWRS